MSYWKRMKDSIATSSATMWTIFTNIIEDTQRSMPIYFVLDALDECEDESREWILKKLGRLFTTSRTESESASTSSTLKVIVTSRPWEDIEFGFRGMTNIRLKTEVEDSIDDDLAIFIKSQVQTLAKRCRYTPEMQQLVTDVLLAKANGMFLWVSLIIKDLSRTPIRHIEQRLKDLPASLYELYDSLLAKVDLSATDRVRCILEWVVTAFRPLAVEELAIACEIASLDPANPPNMEDLVSSMKWDIGLCGPLLTIRYGVVHLVHQSAKDYLLNQHARLEHSKNAASFQINGTESHAKIAVLCLKYFWLGDLIKGDSAYRNPRPPDGVLAGVLPPQDGSIFQKYSMDYWPEHVRQSQDCTPELLSLMEKFFLWYEDVAIRLQEQSYYTMNGGRAHQSYLTIHPNSNPLQFAIYLGLRPVIECSLNDPSVDVNAPDGFGVTPLMRCIERPPDADLEFELKRDLIVRILLGHGASVHSTDFSSATPLHYAALHGNFQVETLIEAGASVDSQDCEGRTPLYRAVCSTHRSPETIQILLSHGAFVDSADHQGMTPLLKLVSGLHPLDNSDTDLDELIYVLSGAGAIVNHLNEGGMSALQLAVNRKVWGVARTLLKCGAHIMLKDANDWNILRQAVVMNDLDLLSLLLKASTKCDLEDSNLVPLLQMAAVDGCVEIVQSLLEHWSCVKSRDRERYLFEARLHRAALEGNVDLLDSLLQTDMTCDFDTTDNCDMDILLQAVTSGNSIIVKALCEKMANTEIGVRRKGKALWLAAAKSNDAIVDCLLGSGAPLEGAKYELGDESTQSDWLREVLSKDCWAAFLVQFEYAENWNPLISATLSGHETTVNLLLERGADIDAKDSEGPSPLQTAVACGHEAVVKVLLKAGAKKSGSLLYLACSRGYASVLRLLLEDGGFDIETKDMGGRTPLLTAIENEEVEILKLLLDKGADYEARNDEACTPLMLAATVDSVEIVRALLQKGVRIEATDQRGRTALHFAAEEGLEAVLKVLLENGADWRHKDNDGNTPLMAALYNRLLMPGIFETHALKITIGLLREWEAEHEELE